MVNDEDDLFGARVDGLNEEVAPALDVGVDQAAGSGGVGAVRRLLADPAVGAEEVLPLDGRRRLHPAIPVTAHESRILFYRSALVYQHPLSCFILVSAGSRVCIGFMPIFPFLFI